MTIVCDKSKDPLVALLANFLSSSLISESVVKESIKPPILLHIRQEILLALHRRSYTMRVG